jgi:hypothetical protein
MEQRIIQRPEWGARHEDGFGPRPVGDLEVYVHHSVTIAPDLLPPFTDDYAAIRRLEQIGEDRFGRGISYQFPITPAGLIFEGVSVDRVGSAIANYNTPSANIVWVGNYDVNNPPLPMLQATDWLLHHGAGKWWPAPVITGGHREAPGAQTACPGRFAQELLDDVNRGAYHTGEPVVVDNPVTPPTVPTVPAQLDVDGKWGSATTRRLQGVLGTTVDGIVSSQSRHWSAANPGLTTGWQWVAPAEARGSRVIAAHQEVLRARGRYAGKLDGLVGPMYVRALQSDLHMSVVDGELWNPSAAVEVLQRRLNEGRV